MILFLYHGTSIGWLKSIGFTKPVRPFGEFTTPHKFIYLASNSNGAYNAAYKASKAAASRLSKEILSKQDFLYNGIQYTPQQCVYKVEVAPTARIFDVSNKQLQGQDWQLLCKALWIGRKSFFDFAISLMATVFKPYDWLATLDGAIGEGGLNRRVSVLAQAGADLIKNVERDSDGQDYGAVYALPIERLRCVTILCKLATSS